MNSIEVGHPVRVITKTGSLHGYGKEGFAYIYDGLYIVKRFWQEKDRDGKVVFKFELTECLGSKEDPQGRSVGWSMICRKRKRIRQCVH